MSLLRCYWKVIKGLCPKCGHGSIVQSRIAIKERCDSCRLKFIDQSGDGRAFLLFLDRALFIFPIVVCFYFGINIKAVIGLCIVLLCTFIWLTTQRLGVSLAIEYWIREGRKIKKPQ
jgi:uncharacterized protein (DUF983 family)|tara:strand:- start:1693 stop:2043 length:351 start_codon:yes stop_codon:yes gene_type:complete